MYVRSFVKCPLCGEEMRLMDGGFYYEGNIGLVWLDCWECHLRISEYGFLHGMEDGEAHSYGKLVKILTDRVKKGVER